MTKIARKLFAAGLVALCAQIGLAATVSVVELCEGMGSVSFLQREAADGQVSLTLKATAADGFAFSGWTVDGSEPEWGKDVRQPSLTGVRVDAAADVRAEFIASEDDRLEFDVAAALDDFTCGERVEIYLEVDSVSFPTLRFSGLPPGLSFSSQSMSVTGSPNTPGLYVVTVAGRNASGYSFSQTFRSVVGNISGRRVSGSNTAISVDTYVTFDFEDLFHCEGEASSVALSGLPEGLEWNPEWRLVYGTPIRAGTFALRADVTFGSETEAATLLLTVEPRSPSAHGVDLSALEDMRVGDVFEERACEIGTYARKEGVVSVSGLPKGLAIKTWYDGGVQHYGIAGVASAAGLYTVSVVVAESDGTDVKTFATQEDVMVADTPSVYLRVGLAEGLDSSSGSVSGGGAVSVGSRATVSATATRGHVFAGWYDENGEPLTLEGNIDYRTPRITFEAGMDLFVYSLYARFVTSAEDRAIAIDNLDGMRFSLSSGEPFDHAFTVRSPSLPSLTFRGLPVGVTYITEGDGSYSLYHDPTASATLEPGRYSVALAASNVSRATASASFVIEVANLKDPRIAVADDYGSFVPGMAIAPIDLSEAVDFAAGETLTVSGLPRGLVYNRSANARTGMKAATITGTPTEPGEYTFVFTARVAGEDGKLETAVATAFARVLPLPGLSAVVDEAAAAAGCKVAGTGTYKAGAKVTLRATAAKGWVFAGWRGLGLEGLDALNPRLPYVTGGSDMQVYADFLPLREDGVFLSVPQLTEAGFAAELSVGVDVATTDVKYLVRDIIETASYPTVKVSGLPPGVKFAQAGFALSGRPSKAGVYYATVEAKSAGGYTFTRVLRVAVAAGGVIPAEITLPNAAKVDFVALDAAVTTGVWYAEGSLALPVAASDGGTIKRVVVSGIPKGLKASSVLVDGGATVFLAGTPGKPGRHTITVTATYENGRSAKSQYAFTVFDGGSAYLDIESLSANLGVANGGGVYAAGATVKLSARAKTGAVFAGWMLADGEPFSDLSEIDGVDMRTASVAFPFRPDSFSDSPALCAAFSPKSDDTRTSLTFRNGGLWYIDPTEDSEFPFSVDSVSLPKLTVKGLPKGVSVDLARGRFVFVANDKVLPGVYKVQILAKNLSGASAGGDIEIRVANRTSRFILGLDPDMDAYPMTVGTASGAASVVPRVADGGWTLTAKGLPPGLSYKNGIVTGVPTRVGVYTVTFVATNGSGRERITETATITIRVSALPTIAVGSFYGFLTGEDGELAGTITLTAASSGKLAAAVVSESGSMTLSASAWNECADVLTAVLTDRGGNQLSLWLDPALGWSEWQMSGVLSLAGGARYEVLAQRNSFGVKDGDESARSALKSVVGVHRQGDVVLTVRNTGAFTLAGKYEGYAFSGAGTVVEDDGLIAGIVKFDAKRGLFSATTRIGTDGAIEIKCHWR